MAVPDAPRVFISYSHDDEPHRKRVLALAYHLRDRGIDVIIDRFEPVPQVRWPLWCEKQIENADIVRLVCTETYHRRVKGEEAPDTGLGVLWEAAVIYQLLYESGPVNGKFLPVLFSDGSLKHIPTPVRGFSRFVVDTPDGQEALYRFLTDQPATPAGQIGERIDMPPAPHPRLEVDARPAAPAAPATPAEPASQAARLFVGRGEERKTLAAVLLAPGRMPVVVSGMAGVGKTYLVDRVFADNRVRFPGGYVRLSLDPQTQSGVTLPGVAELLAAALGRRPLALHLAAGYLKHGGETPASFLKWLRAKGLALPPYDANDPALRERSKVLLSATFDLSLAALRRDGEAAGEAREHGLLALGWAAAAGVGESLGAAIAGLDDDAFGDMARAAARLSLLERLARPDGPAFRLHPLLAELGRSRADGTAAIARMTEWFCARLPEPGEDEPWRWTEVHAETPALLDLLVQVPAAERVRIVRVGMNFAIHTGPFHAWLRFCETALEGEVDVEERSIFFWVLGWVAYRMGLLDRALVAATKKRELDQRLGDDRQGAMSVGMIVTILASCGKEEEALRISREEEVPVYERLGDVRERAVAMGRIADILESRGELDEALRIRHEDVLPVFERLGDERAGAVTKGKIADLLKDRGQLDEALCIYLKEELAVYERLGDVRGCAITMGKIANVMQAWGKLDEALRIHREEELPVYERQGDMRACAETNLKIADILMARGQVEEALDIHQEKLLPAFKWMKAERELLIAQVNTAQLLLVRNHDGDHEEAHRLLCLALVDARRMRIPAAQQIEAILAEHGLACDETPAAAVP